MRAVRFHEFGGVEVLQIDELPTPQLTPDRVLVRVRAAAINPGEISIREGLMQERFPTCLPCGEGTDLAGVVEALGEKVDDLVVGEEVIGWSEERSSHAELVAVPLAQIVPKPVGLPWPVAGSMFVAPMAALACIEAVDPKAGEVVAVSAAAGGVGGVAVQLARRTGATVVGLASQANHDWLREHDIVPVAYGEGQAERLREAAGGHLDAFIDTFGGGYVELALDLGVAKDRINTISDFAAVQNHGVQAQGSHQIANSAHLAELAELAASGELEIPIAATYPLDHVREAYRELAHRHTRGKIVLEP